MLSAWENFKDGIRSEETKFDYTRKLRFFLEFAFDVEIPRKAQWDEESGREQLEITRTYTEKFVKRAKQKKGFAEGKILDFIRKQRGRAENKQISGSHLRNMLKPVRLLLEMNDIALNWRKIMKFAPPTRRYAHDRAPSVEEIRKLLTYADPRAACVILMMATGGVRIGSFNYYTWRDIEPVYREKEIVAAKLTVYRGEEEEYFTFVTPECYRYISDYIAFRKSFGEEIRTDSPLIRDKFETAFKDTNAAQNSTVLKAGGVKRLIEHALWQEGIRKEKRKRHEFAADHGFRKFFKTRAEQVMKPINVETLMGHSTGISDSYYRPTEKELLEDYLKAGPLLTVSEVEEVRQQALGLEQKNSERLRQLEEFVSRLVAEKGEQVLALDQNRRRNSATT